MAHSPRPSRYSSNNSGPHSVAESTSWPNNLFSCKALYQYTVYGSSMEWLWMYFFTENEGFWREIYSLVRLRFDGKVN